MSITPHPVSQKIDSILNSLNCKWDLQLPYLHGVDARNAANESISGRCSLRIRYLCWRSESSIDSCIAEFEDQARDVLSRNDVGQARDATSLQSPTASRTFLLRDNISAFGGIASEQRQHLLNILFDLLEDEHRLAKDSTSYQRTSGHQPSITEPTYAPPKKPSGVRPRTPSPKRDSRHDRNDVGAATSPQKRRRVISETQPNTRPEDLSKPEVLVNVQQNLFKYFPKSKRPDGVLYSEVDDFVSNKPTLEEPTENAKSFTNMSSNANTSFATTTSFEPSVFSQADSHGTNSSTNLSIVNRDQNAESQDYFPTQDANDYFADESFTSELHAADASTTLTDFTIDLLRERTPFLSVDQLPEGLPFWICWELCRVAQATSLPLKLLCTVVETSTKNITVTYNEFWRNISMMCKDHSKMLPEKSDVRSWIEHSNEYQSPKGKTASFTLNLEYLEHRGPYLWKLKLNPIKIDQGNRIHRKFGSDRHVIASIPYFDKKSLPKWVVKQRDFDEATVFRNISHWLATNDHYIAGRSWRGFYLEEKKKSRRSADEEPRLKLNLFAVDGIGIGKPPNEVGPHHLPTTMRQLVNWHISPNENATSTDLKLFSRFGLALSKTRSTVILEQHQFQHLQDVEPVMNDGCALMSLSMAKAVWEICSDGSTAIPSAFQGRIGGAKGLWVIDYRGANICHQRDALWIQISDSQLKIEPHPKDWTDADETQRCFEVLKWSKPCVPGHLNIQLINILADCGVARSVLRQIVLDDIENYIEAARGAMQDPRLLQAWLQVYHCADRQDEPVAFEHGLPETKEDEINLLVQSGFSAENNEYVRRGVIGLMTQRLSKYVEKLRIEVKYSTTAFCVPDPYQVLQENEVYMGFSQPCEVSETGVKETVLTDIDVLVARNPAALASDIQKRRAVYKHQLRHFRDVIVFSTKGTTPLASLLSGGDYDGDTVTVIWDARLVDSFHNVQKPQLPSIQKCGLVEESRKVSDIFQSTIPSDTEIDEFVASCFQFNARPTRVGICTNEHEKLIYNGAKLSDPGAILLAALAGYLVDANKQGLGLTDEAWYKINKTALAGRKLFDLAYKKGEHLPRRYNGECVNIMDHLKFDVAMKRKDDVLIEFENMLPDATHYDSDLTIPYKRELKRASKASDVQSTAVATILTHLRTQLTLAHRVWVDRTQKREKNHLERSDVSGDIRDISGLIKDIEPPEVDCDIFADFLREDICEPDAVTTLSPVQRPRNFVKGTRWSLLRASAMYSIFWKSKMTWWTVGDELGRIKARSQGSTRELTPAMHHITKADTRLIKYLTGKAMHAEFDDAEA